MKPTKQILSAYLEAALWASTDDNGDPLDSSYSFEDVAISSALSAARDIRSFLELIGPEDLEAYKAECQRTSSYHWAEMMGHDLWLTRNHHGAGFWDRGHGDLGKRLTAWAHSLGSSDAYVGDDGKVYFS
jgi:hypothetical protein